jgi:coenzyme F420 hydrogenase subunit delta
MSTGSLTNTDVLPTFCRAQVLILGVGNTLFGDDGFGPEVVETLIHDYDMPKDVCAMDVGTGARKVLFTLVLSAIRPQEIVIVDAVDWGQDVGQVVEIPVEALPITKVDDFSLHQAPTSNLLLELQKRCGVKVTVMACDVGAVPQVIEPGLSPTIRQAVTVACRNIVEHLSLYQVRARAPRR